MQLAPGFVWVVHAADAQAQLEAQLRVVAQCAGHLWQQLTPHMQSQFVAVDHDFLYGIFEFDAVALQCLGQPVDNLVEVSAVGPGASVVDRDLAYQPSVSRRVAGAVDAEHASADVDQLFFGLVGGRQELRPPRWLPASGRAPVSSSQQSAHLDRRPDGQRRLFGFGDGLLAVDAQRHFLNLVVQLEDCVQQHLRTGRAAG